MKKYTRHDERIKTMQAFYAVFVALENNTEYDATKLICDQYRVDSFDDVPVFSKCVYSIGLEHYDEIVSIISKYLVNWTFNRLSNVDKAILFLGVADGRFAKITPPKVIIDECIILAKNYSDSENFRYINAVLNKAVIEDGE